jgi:DNA-directed DNA polymerase III PolC
MHTLWGARTFFSVGESILKPDSFLKRIKELGYSHVAIADTMSVSALISASSQAKKLGIEVISGCTLRIQHWDKEEVIFQPKVYCNSGDSFVALMQTLSDAQEINKQQTITWADFASLLSRADFTVTTGDALSVFSSAFPEFDVTEFFERVRTAQSANEKSALVVELVAVQSPYYDRVNALAKSYASMKELPYVISAMPLYETPDHAEARDIMHAIIRKLPLDHGARQILEGTDMSLKTPEQVEAICGKPHPDEAAIVDALSWRWSKMPVSLPKLADDEFQALVSLCKAGWVARVGSPVLGYKPDATLIPEYVARLKMELGVLKQLGFCNYFLLVADLVTWSKSNGIIVGPGRGSVGGSLVAFLTGITDVDPIRFNLLFERFINPERLDLPDADLDFMSARRHEVVNYLTEKYGTECVAHISNYNTLGPTSAIGDVGKILGVPDREMGFRSYLPKEHGQAVPLEKCLLTVGELQEYADKHEHAYQTSLILEDQLRAMGTHAAGIIAAAEPIKNRAVVTEKGEVRVVNWDKQVVEDQGLVKIDILGLTNLDVLGRAIGKIEHDYGRKVDLLAIPLDDEKTLDAFGRGDTVGVFQFESGGMRKLLKDLAKGGQLTFEDLSAATALYRPGPLDSGMTEDYVAVRQGVTTPDYDHPAMEPVLKDTNGQLVYQEQTMALSRALCGYSGAEADGLRKIIGKKDKDKMKQEREKFVAGATAGWVEVALSDGSVKTVHRMEKFKCIDNKIRTVEESIACDIEISQW